MHSLHRRLTLSLLAVLAGLIAAGSVALYWGFKSSLLAQFDRGLRIKALVVITGTQQNKTKLDVRFSDHFLREFDDDIATDFYQVRTVDGANVERSDALNKGDLPERFGTLESPEYWDLPLPFGRGAGRAIGIRFHPRIDRRDKVAVANPIEATVVVASQREELDAILRRLKIALAIGGAGLLGATSLAVPLVLRPGLRPVRRVADLAQTIDANTLGHRFPVDDLPRELQPICKRLNDLLARIETSFERERRFSSDLAHELLTPLTEMRMIAESALKWPETAGPEDYQRLIEIMGRTENLVNQVLELARAENGSLTVQVSSINIAELVRELIHPHADQIQERGLTLAPEGPDPLWFESDPGALRVILGNLCANAAAYAPEGSTVRIGWAHDDLALNLSVSNPAPHIGAEDLPQLFKRFWRKDESRTGSQHSGLGLAVAAELAVVLGGSLTAKKTDADELKFTLNLPSRPASA